VVVTGRAVVVGVFCWLPGVLVPGLSGHEPGSLRRCASRSLTLPDSIYICEPAKMLQ
jgi:hypothetical protein